MNCRKCGNELAEGAQTCENCGEKVVSSVNSPAVVSNRGATFLPFIISLVTALLLVLTFFLPFSSATDEYQKSLDRLSDTGYTNEAGVEIDDVASLSMMKYAQTYGKIMSADISSRTTQNATVYLVIIVVLGVLSLLTLLFALLKKPVAAIIFNVLTFGVFTLLRTEFSNRGILPSSHYDYGIANYLYYICFVAVIVSAIWFIIVRRNEKKAAQTA